MFNEITPVPVSMTDDRSPVGRRYRFGESYDFTRSTTTVTTIQIRSAIRSTQTRFDNENPTDIVVGVEKYCEYCNHGRHAERIGFCV